MDVNWLNADYLPWLILFFPLLGAGIIMLGRQLGVPFHLTLSCYDPVRGRACGRCDACELRRKGFAEAGVPDPTHYAANS